MADRVTLDEAKEETQKETDEEEEHLEGEPNRGVSETEGPEAPDKSLEEVFEDVENFTITPPDFLKSGVEDRDDTFPGTGGRRGEGGDDGDGPLETDPRDLIRLIPGADEAELLEIIARVNVANFITNLDIADYLSPLSDITVSGTNAISSANQPEPVVPNSDSVDIPTRKIFIKANTNNKKPIAFGDDQSDPDSGFILGPGESIVVGLDLRGEPIYMSSERSGQEIEVLGML